MNLTNFRPAFAWVGLLVALALPATSQAQQGTIGGRVTDKSSGQPLVGARVGVVGTALAVQTNADGRYVLANVKAGPATVRVSAIGYGAVTQTVTVTAGEPAAQDFALSLQPFSLDEVVVTATGDQAKREMGNQVSRLTADSLVANAPIADINDLLTSRAPGVSVFESPITGAEARVRIRGANSLSLSNEPIYYIDGIRMESSTGSSSIGIGGTNPSRVNDINPEEIESIEIVKGPSAATLYGTDAVNGVIVIRTKRGRAGAPKWNVYSEGGIIQDYNQWPTAFRGWTSNPPPPSVASVSTNGVQCLLVQVAAGACTQDSVSRYNLWEDPTTSPLRTGWRGQVGAQVSGGSDQVRYFLSTEREEEIGLLSVPDFAWNRYVTKWSVSEMPYEYYRPNARDRTSLRANVQANLSQKFDVQIATGFVNSYQRLPQTDNNTTGLMSNALGGPGHRDNWRLGAPDTAMLFGYRAFTPEEMFAEVVDQRINRFIGSGTLNWHPNSWLTGRAVTGLDFTNRVDTDLCKRNECTPFSLADTVGNKTDNRTGFHDYTVNGDLAATYPVSAVLRGKTTFGLQFYHSLFERNGAFGQDLPPGATTVTPGSTLSASEATTESKTLGAFVEQHFAYKERLYVTAALRGDDNSAFGQDFRAAYYPKLSASYVISEESYFPTVSWLSNLRLRAAIGASGQQPGSTDAIQFFAPTVAAVDGANKPAVVFSSSGNIRLKPERASEIELGFDATLLESRVSVEFTYYRKRAKDALIARVVAPSVGANATRFENLGAVRNSGLELSLNAIVANRPNFGWDLTLNLSHNTNVIEDLGKDETGQDIPPIVGTTIRQVEGYPINGYWQRPILGYNDVNGNGLIEAWEVIVGDSAKFVGPSLPPTEATFLTGVDLLNRRLRISATFDYKGGRWQLNGTERIRCESRLNCDGEIDPNAPLWKQARVVALRDHPARTQWGFFEPADAVRWRELAVTYELPGAVSRAMHASRVSVTASGRNLMKWTKYSGIDPESGYVDGGLQTDFQTQPPPTYWMFRVNLSF